MPIEVTGPSSSCDALLIVPPFAIAHRPSLAAHLLQACARDEGYEVNVLYANVGHPGQVFLGERIFSHAAFGWPQHGGHREGIDPRVHHHREPPHVAAKWPEFEQTARRSLEWAGDVAAAVASRNIPIVGATINCLQTCAGIALLNLIKSHRPETTTILDGAGCEGQMAEGVGAVTPAVDFIFSGECETTFPEFLRRHSSGELQGSRIIRGEPCQDLDRLPTPDYTEYFDQLQSCIPEASFDSVWLPYETSRGCWWGQKRRCTFCGLNGTRVGYREKSPEQVLTDLADIDERYPTSRVGMTDNIMPRSYLDSLIPRMAHQNSKLRIFYEQRPGLSLEQVVSLKEAGITAIQAGIEAISPSLLRRLEKGTTVAKNIELLRYARTVKMAVHWNLLCHVPGDLPEEYEETLALLPLLRHLAPASHLFKISLARFSRYLDDPGSFGIQNVKPSADFSELFPCGTDVRKIAYYFDGDYPSASRDDPTIVQRLADEINTTRNLWARPSGTPLLHVRRLGNNLHVLEDSREVSHGPETRLIHQDQAWAALGAGPGVPASAIEWAIERQVGVRIDGRYVPLATADPPLLAHFEELSGNPDRRIAERQSPAWP